MLSYAVSNGSLVPLYHKVDATSFQMIDYSMLIGLR